MTEIGDRLAKLRTTLPPHVELVAAAKSRSPEEISAAIAAGVRMIGHNYVQEAADMIRQLGRGGASWTLIGHLQRNKVKTAVGLFDSIQTLDSLKLAEAVERECQRLGRRMPVLIEVNSAREPRKSGVFPDDVFDLVRGVSQLESVHVRGLMTLGPQVPDPKKLRPYFRQTKALFDRIAAEGLAGVDMSVLSMGMSDSYAVAIEEGSTMVRLGTALFGPRPQ